MFNLLHVYGLTFQDGKFTADAARECDQKTLNRQLVSFNPTRIYSGVQDKNYRLSSDPLKGETVFELKRIGIGIAYGNLIHFSDPVPESGMSGNTQISMGMLKDENSGWLVVIAEVESLNKVRSSAER